MHGFRTSRALVIDDKPLEAMPVIQALGIMGIASLYHDASPDADYSQKHTGIRLLFLDMVLANRSATEGDPEGAANALTGALGQLIELSSEPVVVVCWTKHKDFKEDFQKAFTRAFPTTRLERVLVFNKEDLSDLSKQQALISQIAEALAALSPLSLLLSWEQMVHNAATRTTNILSKLVHQAAADGKTPWTDRAYQVCAALALAERGTRLVGEQSEHALTAFHDCLTPLLADQLDHMGLKPVVTEPTQENADPAEQPISRSAETPTQGVSESNTPGAAAQETVAKTDETGKKKPVPTAAEATPSGALKEATPTTAKGAPTVALAQEVKDPTFSEETLEAVKVSAETAAKLLQTVKDEAALWKDKQSLLSSASRAGLNSMLLISSNVRPELTCPGYIYALNNSKPGDPPNPNLLATKQCLTCWQDAGPDTFVIDQKFPYDHIPVLVEVTPTCDFAQDKSKLPRFVAGYLFPESGLGKFRHLPAHTRLIGPLSLERPAQPKLSGVYYLGLNAHFLPSLNKSIIKQMTAFMRLRANVLADVIAWVSEQSSRPGYTTVGPQIPLQFTP